MLYQALGMALVLASVVAGAVWLRRKKAEPQERLWATLSAAAVLLCLVSIKIDSLLLLAVGFALLPYASRMWRLIIGRKRSQRGAGGST